jgi:anti-anti-sigma factor
MAMQRHLIEAPYTARPGTGAAAASVRQVRIPLPAGRHISVTRIFRLVAQLPGLRHNDIPAVDAPSPVHVRMRMTALSEPNIVELSGEIDASTAAEFWTHLECVPTVENVVADLSGVGFMGAAGLTLLLRFRQRLAESDATLRLTGVSSMVRTMITLVNLQEALICVPEVDQAA